jgi:hypothetical protein
MSWTLFVQILILMTWGGVLARTVVDGIHKPLGRDRKEPKA